jgi:hypothetical protein
MATSMPFQDIVGPMMIDEWICGYPISGKPIIISQVTNAGCHI